MNRQRLSLAQVVAILARQGIQVGQSTLRTEAAAKRLKADKVGKTWITSWKSVRKWLAERENA